MGEIKEGRKRYYKDYCGFEMMGLHVREEKVKSLQMVEWFGGVGGVVFRGKKVQNARQEWIILTRHIIFAARRSLPINLPFIL